MPSSSATETHSFHQQHALLRIYTLYRCVLALTLIVMYVSSTPRPIIGQDFPKLFLYTALGYLVLSGWTIVLAIPGKGSIPKKPLAISLLFDLMAISIISFCSGGISIGLPILMLVTVSAGSMFFSTQISVFLAAVASLSILADGAYRVLFLQSSFSSMLPTGLLGGLYFAAALLIRSLAERLHSSEQLAERRAKDVSTLEDLTQQIVQKMRTGVVIVSAQGEIKLQNRSAKKLLSQLSEDNTRSNLPNQLLKELERWKQQNSYHPPIQRLTQDGPSLQVRFSSLGKTRDDDTLVYLENHAQLIQQAQHLKLASLGRLTASIAHEIRNPLGAVSHAAQLLAESEQLNAADQRLTEIIQNHSKRMNQIIENVLQLSRRSPTQAEETDLESWLNGCIEGLRETYTDPFEIQLKNHSDYVSLVNIDRAQMRQVFDNLVQNGLRYSNKATGKATIELHIHQSKSDKLPILDIIDQGPGISDEEIHSIFEPFYTTDPEGSGLGLYIAKELCEANQASLDYLRTLQGESCFRISFSHPHKKPHINE